MIDPLLSSILVCPADHGSLTENVARSRLICSECGRRYPVRDGVPIMLIEQAESDDDD
jgi:hypothetical protein